MLQTLAFRCSSSFFPSERAPTFWDEDCFTCSAIPASSTGTELSDDTRFKSCRHRGPTRMTLGSRTDKSRSSVSDRILTLGKRGEEGKFLLRLVSCSPCCLPRTRLLSECFWNNCLHGYLSLVSAGTCSLPFEF